MESTWTIGTTIKLKRGEKSYVVELSARPNDRRQVQTVIPYPKISGELAKVEGLSSVKSILFTAAKVLLHKTEPLFELLMAFRLMFTMRWFGERIISRPWRFGASGRLQRPNCSGNHQRQ